MQNADLLPGELAARAGVTVSALHFYERQCALLNPDDTPSAEGVGVALL